MGGCIDVIRHLAGTPFGDVKAFQKTFLKDEPILWYFENCELNAASVKRSLVQLKQQDGLITVQVLCLDEVQWMCQWKGINIRTYMKNYKRNYKYPIFYDIDCGHVPPQMTLINGAYAEVQLQPQGKAVLKQAFLS